MRAGFRRRGAGDQRGRVNRPFAISDSLGKFRCTARGAEIAAEILQAPTSAADLIANHLDAIGPVGLGPVRWSCARFCAHRTRSRNMLTCDDSTPPSPWRRAI